MVVFYCSTFSATKLNCQLPFKNSPRERGFRINKSESYLMNVVLSSIEVRLSIFSRAPLPRRLLLHSTTLIFSLRNWKKNYTHSNIYIDTRTFFLCIITNLFLSSILIMLYIFIILKAGSFNLLQILICYEVQRIEIKWKSFKFNDRDSCVEEIWAGIRYLVNKLSLTVKSWGYIWETPRTWDSKQKLWVNCAWEQ